MHQILLYARITYMQHDFDSSLLTEHSGNFTPKGLSNGVVMRLRRTAMMRFLVGIFAAGPLFISSIFAWKGVLLEMAETGFGEYVSLLATDLHAVLLHWQEFTLSLLESFPLFSMITLTVVLFGWLYILRLCMVSLSLLIKPLRS